ncbi:MAG: hypothetical protein GY749_49365 [Desulfobacteraceae bacterium]|nr:hypothetical protein [Desulfobacteraceae bacterium]
MKTDGNIIIGRWALMGGNKLPLSEFGNLAVKHIMIFLTEPDTQTWPPEMEHLKKYTESAGECPDSIYIHKSPLLSAQSCCYQS